MIKRAMTMSALCALLSACGGGGGGGGTTPEPPADPALLAQKAGLSGRYWVKPGELYSSSLRVTLKWTDVFTNESGYRIDVQEADGQWKEAGRQPAQTGSGGELQFDLPGWLAIRVVAELPGQTVVLRTVSQQQALAALPWAPSELDLATEQRTLPLSSVVNLGLRQAMTGQPASSLTLNGQTLQLPAPDYHVAWDTRSLEDGRYPYTLVRPLDADRRFEVAGALTVANSNPSAIIKWETNGELVGADIDILRWDDAAGANPQLLVDGAVVESPVVAGCQGDWQCLKNGGRNLQGLYVRVKDYVSGNHVMTVRMASKSGPGKDYTGTVAVDRLPVVTLAADPAGSVLGAELRLQGRLSDDGRPATLRVLLDGELRAQAEQGDFDLRLDTSGLAEGEHLVSLVARDSAGQEVRQDRPVLKLAAGRTAQLMGAELRLLGASPSSILAYDPTRPYEAPFVWLRAGSPVARLVLPIDHALPDLVNWAVSDKVVVGAVGGYAPRRLFQWDTLLQRSELGTGIGGAFDLPLVEGSWLAHAVGDTASTETRVVLRKLETATVVEMKRLPGFSAFGVSLNAGALATMPDGSARLVWQADDALLLGSSLSGAPVVLERGDFAQPMTDGTQVAWKRNGAGGQELMVRAVVPGGTPTRVAPQTGQQLGRMALRDGLLTWTETGGGKSRLYVLSAGQAQLVVDDIGELVDTAQQRIVFGQGDRLMVWTAARGAQAVFPAGGAILKGATLMVQFNAMRGSTPYLYRVPLEQFD